MRALLGGLAILLAGCASTSPRGAFQDTAQLVLERTGQRVVWDQGGDADRAVRDRLRQALARPLDAEAAVLVALLSNKEIRVTYEELSVAQADLVQAGLLANPTLSGGVSFPVAGQATTGFNLSITEDFLRLFELAARKRVAKARLEATERRVADAVVRLAYDVRAAFYTLEGAEQTLRMRKEMLESSEAALDLAERQRAAGNSSDLDFATQRALYEQGWVDEARSELEALTAREAMNRLLGLWGQDTGWTTVGKLPELPPAEPPLEHLESLAVSRRLDLAAARAEAEAASQQVAMAKNFRFLGGAEAGATYEKAPEGFTVAGPSAGVELPIFDQKQAVIARLEAELRQAEARRAALAVEIRAEVRSSRARLLAARSLVERYLKTVVPLRQQLVALSQQQYSAMLLGPYQLLQAKQSQVNAYRELIEALRDYWIGRADLERATGGSLPLARAATPPP